MHALKRLPGARALATYRGAWLRDDLVAGLVLTTLLVPQGMAYAELAGLPPITGLYTSILCLLGYAVFGPSRILVLGPDSSLGPMIAATILPIVGSDGDPERAVALASMLALMVGVDHDRRRASRELGFIADLLSKPTQIGYMNGLALTILVGQLPKLFGFSVDANGLIDEARGVRRRRRRRATVVGAALAIGLVSLALILGLQRWLPKVPGVLVGGRRRDRSGGRVRPRRARRLARRRRCPQGFPPLTIPRRPAPTSPLLVGGALGIALVVAGRHDLDGVGVRGAHGPGGRRQRRDDRHRRRERRAPALFQGFPVSTSGSRTAVAEQAGRARRS